MNNYFLYRITFQPQNEEAVYSNSFFGITNNVMSLSTSGKIETYDSTLFYPGLIFDEGKFSFAADITSDNGFFDFNSSEFSVQNDNGILLEYIQDHFVISGSSVEVFYCFDDGSGAQIYNEFNGILISITENEDNDQTVSFDCDCVTEISDSHVDHPVMIGNVREAEFIYKGFDSYNFEGINRLPFFESIGPFINGATTVAVPKEEYYHCDRVSLYADRDFILPTYLDNNLDNLIGKYLIILDGAGKNFFAKITGIGGSSINSIVVILNYPIYGIYKPANGITFVDDESGNYLYYDAALMRYDFANGTSFINANSDKPSIFAIVDSLPGLPTALVSDLSLDQINLKSEIEDNGTIWKIRNDATGIVSEEDFCNGGEEQPNNAFSTANGPLSVSGDNTVTFNNASEDYPNEIFSMTISNGQDATSLLGAKQMSWFNMDYIKLFQISNPYEVVINRGDGEEDGISYQVSFSLDFDIKNLRNLSFDDDIYVNFDFACLLGVIDQNQQRSFKAKYKISYYLISQMKDTTLSFISPELPSVISNENLIFDYPQSYVMPAEMYNITKTEAIDGVITHYNLEHDLFSSEYKFTKGSGSYGIGIPYFHGEYKPVDWQTRYTQPIRIKLNDLFDIDKERYKFSVFFIIKASYYNIDESISVNQITHPTIEFYLSSITFECPSSSNALLKGRQPLVSEDSPYHNLITSLYHYNSVSPFKTIGINSGSIPDNVFKTGYSINDDKVSEFYSSLVKACGGVVFANRHSNLTAEKLYDEPASGEILPVISVRSDFVDDLKLFYTPIENIYNAFEISIGENSVYTLSGQDELTWSTAFITWGKDSVPLNGYENELEEIWNIMSESYRTTRIKKTLSIDLSSVTDSDWLMRMLMNSTNESRQYIAKALHDLLLPLVLQYGFRHKRADVKIPYDLFIRGVNAIGEEAFDLMKWVLIEDPVKTSEAQPYRIISIDLHRDSGTADLICLSKIQREKASLIDERPESFSFIDETPESNGCIDEAR